MKIKKYSIHKLIITQYNNLVNKNNLIHSIRKDDDKMKKYVQVGCGSRGTKAYAAPLVKEYGDCGELCGVYDINRKRAELVSEYAGKNIPVYDDFDEIRHLVIDGSVIPENDDIAFPVHELHLVGDTLFVAGLVLQFGPFLLF